ncbi:arsenate reductase ArsC [Streptomyces sp. N1]|uniref:arsenate-mycothiol transferase ArsC n=1 Tax=Streptomyces sp. N1 TaxID=576456 RepID=UPI001F50C2E5|nr:arsenate reductase ArsC [Streptomyces sp. N1]
MTMSTSPAMPSVLFVCVHNAGRSQTAAGWPTHLAGERIEVRSASSTPSDAINPAAITAMAEVGIGIAGERPKLLSTDTVRASDVCITMGYGDTCPIFPSKHYLDWPVKDPEGQNLEDVRPIRDQIRVLVENLISEITPVGSAN